jgi:hypothetical protein
MPDDVEGERRREGGGASSKLTNSRLVLRVWLTVGRSPVADLGARGRGGSEFFHAGGDVGVEAGSREGPAFEGSAGERIDTDCVER